MNRQSGIRKRFSNEAKNWDFYKECQGKRLFEILLLLLVKHSPSGKGNGSRKAPATNTGSSSSTTRRPAISTGGTGDSSTS